MVSYRLFSSNISQPLQVSPDVAYACVCWVLGGGYTGYDAVDFGGVQAEV